MRPTGHARHRVLEDAGLLRAASEGDSAGFVSGETGVDETRRQRRERGDRGHSNRSRRRALGEQRAQACEGRQRAEIVELEARFRRPASRIRDDGVDSAAGQPRHALHEGGAPLRRGEVGNEVGVPEIDPDHPSASRADPSGSRLTDP